MRFQSALAVAAALSVANAHTIFVQLESGEELSIVRILRRCVK